MLVDYKAKVDDRIQEELPALAAKTTYLYFGYYPSNLSVFPFLKPSKLVSMFPNVVFWFPFQSYQFEDL